MQSMFEGRARPPLFGLPGVSVQVVTGLTGDFQPNASLVVVATPDVGNRDQTRSCPCDCLFDLLFNKMSKTLQSHSFSECNWKKRVK